MNDSASNRMPAGGTAARSPAARLSRFAGSSRAHLVGLLLLMALAAGLRLWSVAHFNRLPVDTDGYLELARHLVDRGGYGYAEPRNPSAYRPPLYPLLLAPLVKAFQGAPHWLNTGIGALHALLGAATAGLTVLAGRRLRLGAWGFLAGLIVAVDPLLVYSAATLMTETLAAFLSVLMLFCALQPRTGRSRLALGIVFGLCCLCRPTFWAFGACAVFGWGVGFWYARSRHDQVRGRRPEDWRRAAVQAVFGTCLVVLPWVVRNQQALRWPILTTTHGGYTLLLAHNPVYVDEVVNRPWGAVIEEESLAAWTANLEASLSREIPRAPKGSRAPHVEVSRDRWMNAQAWQFIRDDPATAMRTGLTLLGRMWNIVPFSTPQRPIPPMARWVLGGCYSAVFLALLTGLVRIRRDEWPLWWTLPVLLVSFSAVHSLYWADMRMRAPLVPAIALLAARACLPRRNRPSNEELINARE